MKKLSLYIFLGMIVSNIVQALPKCEGKHNEWVNCYGAYLKLEISPGWTVDYEGEFGNIPGIREGTGSATTYKDGVFSNSYVGDWKNNQPHGKGIDVLVNVGKYEGDFIDGNFHGYGIFTWKNGTKYEGEWKNHFRYGEGHMIFSNGSEYIGNFKNGKFEGEGTFIKEGISTKGIWKNNKLVKQN